MGLFGGGKNTFDINAPGKIVSDNALNAAGAYTDWDIGPNALGNAYGKNGIVPFYKGGIVDRPTIFPFADGIGLMGEKSSEAILPLKRGRDGKLGVESSGGGGTVVNVSVDAAGTNVEGNNQQMEQLGTLLGAAVEAEIAKQKMPGGMLY